jgi:hypothetical protein
MILGEYIESQGDEGFELMDDKAVSGLEMKATDKDFGPPAGRRDSLTH